MLRLLDLTLTEPAANLALDEALLDRADRTGAETLRFWELPVPVVVLGLSRKAAEDVNLEACSRAGVPVLRRASGGGTVVLGPGCLCFSLVLSLGKRPELRDIRQSYGVILAGVARAIGFPGVECSGASDLTLDGKKFSGNAQKRARRSLLHHGTILYDFHLPLLPLLLREPARQPVHRAGRLHLDFVRNLPLPAAEIKSRIAGHLADARSLNPPRARPRWILSR